MRIDRCVCTDRSFEDLRAEADRRGWGLGELMRHTGAGDGCQMCFPYLRRMMRTGQTVFTELLSEET